jgi:hypothetical protein
MYISTPRLCRYLLLVALMALPAVSAWADVYDKPSAIKKLLVHGDAQDPSARHEISCYIYPTYTIKQLNYGEVGAERLSILPTPDGKAVPCRQAKEADEYVLPPETWSGYFDGVKAGYAFFTASDGANGGMGFIVLRLADKKKLFEDAYEKSFESITVHDGVPVIRYRRVYAGNCSVVTDGASCADAIARETGVTKASLGICTSGYRALQQSLARERCKADGKSDAACIKQESDVITKQKWDASPTVIVYEAELDLHETTAPDRPVGAPSIKALGNALSCRPAD